MDEILDKVRNKFQKGKDEKLSYNTVKFIPNINEESHFDIGEIMHL